MSIKGFKVNNNTEKYDYEALDNLPELEAAIAPSYTEKPYNVGDYAWYNGTLYRCTIPITTAETWTAAHWMATVLGNDVNELKSALGEQTQNLWTWGDQSYIRKTTLYNINIPAGTYTLSAVVTRESTGDANINSRVVFYKQSIESANALANPYLPTNSGRNSTTFTLAEKADILVMYSSSTDEQSINVDANWQDVMLESGNTATPYYVPTGLTAVDAVARGRLSEIEERNNVVIESNLVVTNDTVDLVLKDIDLLSSSVVVTCDACFTRNSGVADYPRLYFSLPNARDMDRNTTYYKIGEENVYDTKEWRVPAFIWGDNRDITIHIVVPEGCTLTIRKMTYRHDSSVDRTLAKGVRFYARPGTCNFVPEMTRPALMMAFRHGYDTFTVIPKISSDGVWFAYHDDTWDIATTQYRNPDRSRITDESYNGLYFHQIPFDYLLQFSAGSLYGTVFADLKTLKLDDCFAFLAKTGMKLRFSMHPATGINTTANLTNLKRLVQKYGLLKDLTIIVNDISSLFPVFGNDIGGYCFGNSVGASWDDDAVTRVDAALTNAMDARDTYGITCPISCGLWSDSLFSNHEKAEELVCDILDEGMTAEVFTYPFTGTDGTTHSYFWSEDIRWLMSIGVTGFTDGYNTSVGLNW